MNAANLCSNSRALGPVVSQPERNTAVAAAISSSPIDGLKHGIGAGATGVLGATVFDARRGWGGGFGGVEDCCDRRCRMVHP
jgi:hypothetical protein